METVQDYILHYYRERVRDCRRLRDHGQSMETVKDYVIVYRETEETSTTETIQDCKSDQEGDWGDYRRLGDCTLKNNMLLIGRLHQACHST